MEEMDSQGELAAGYMLVPWASWDEWNFVRESLFSSSPDSVTAALKRVTAWRSRGCLPVAIQVTGAIVEIQKKDPFFSEGQAADNLNSEDILVMLYSMAIMRLVNGFVEKVNGFDNRIQNQAVRKKKYSICQVADAIGIPRIVVDIRHECSHRDLPSLPLLRLACMKALEWLKTHYWGPQQRMIPDVQKEIRSRLHKVASCLKVKYAGRKQPVALRVCNKLSSQISGKLLSSNYDGFHKQILKSCKVIARLYSVHPKEVVSALLEIYNSQIPSLSSIAQVDCNDDSDSDSGNKGTLESLINDFKAIVAKLASKKPGLVLTMLKEILDKIEAHKNSQCENEHLSSFVPWLLMKLKALKDSNQIRLTDEPQILTSSTTVVPKVSLWRLLNKCLILSASGNKYLSISALLISEIIGDDSLNGKLRKLSSISLQKQDYTMESTPEQHTETNIIQIENSLKQAAEKLQALKCRSNIKSTAEKAGNQGTKRTWTMAKSWTPCPIGMLPCLFSSTAFLPVLNRDKEQSKAREEDVVENKCVNYPSHRKRNASCEPEMETAISAKKFRDVVQGIGMDSGHSFPSFPLGSRLLIGGIWRTVGEEELLDIESNIRILV